MENHVSPVLNFIPNLKFTIFKRIVRVFLFEKATGNLCAFLDIDKYFCLCFYQFHIVDSTSAILLMWAVVCGFKPHHTREATLATFGGYCGQQSKGRHNANKHSSFLWIGSVLQFAILPFCSSGQQSLGHHISPEPKVLTYHCVWNSLYSPFVLSGTAILQWIPCISSSASDGDVINSEVHPWSQHQEVIATSAIFF